MNILYHPLKVLSISSTLLLDFSSAHCAGEQVRKSVFLLFFQGEELKSRIKKVCEGYHASIYPCPELLEERREMLVGVETRLEDLDRILKETNDHRQSFLKDKGPFILLCQIISVECPTNFECTLVSCHLKLASSLNFEIKSTDGIVFNMEIQRHLLVYTQTKY